MKKNKRKQNLVAITCLVAFLVFIVAGILAYLTDTDEKINNFKIGNVDIILHEYSWNPTAYTTDDESGEPDAVETNFGETVPKDPQVENVGKNPAYIYIKVEVPRASYEEGLTTIINESLFEYTIDDANWTELESARSVDETGKYNVYYYYYNDVLRSQEITTPLFEEITLKDNIPGVEDDVLTVKVNAYAIQANGLPEGTTVDTTEWAKEFITQGVDQGVSKSIQIAVGDGTLDNYELALEADDTAQIVLKKPQGAQGDFEEYTFSSEDSSIASVDANGLITAIDGGETTITILGSVSGTTKTITVNVTGKIPVEDCDVSVANDVMFIGDTEQIKIKKPAGRTGKIEPVTYTSSITSIATVDSNGLITAVAPGNITVTILGSKSGTSKTIDIRVKDSNVVGAYVDLNTNILNRSIKLKDGTSPQTDWRVFYQDESGTLLILADYLPTSKLPSGVALTAVETYGVKASSGNLGNISQALSDRINWKKLINENLGLYNNSEVIVRGAPTLPEWVSSWNTNPAHTQVAITGETTYSINPENMVSLADRSQNSLYFSHSDRIRFYYINSWDSSGRLFRVDGANECVTDTNDYWTGSQGLRPTVYFPSSITFNTDNEVWTIAN